MDIPAFQKDLRAELLKLPPDLVPILRELATKFGPKLEPLVMGLVANLQRHVVTMMGELSLGILTKDEVEAAIMDVFKETA